MKFLPVAALALSAASPAFAGTMPVLLDFEAVTSFASIDNLYGSYGVQFTGDALGLVNDSLGTYFSHAPSAIGVMAPVGPDATLNVALGFVDSLGFFYSTTGSADVVEIWSGLDGTGTKLASISLAANAQADGCSDTDFCYFGSSVTQFAGIAHSVTFGGATGAAFDNVSLTTVPEPTSALLAALALGGLALTSRRSR